MRPKTRAKPKLTCREQYYEIEEETGGDTVKIQMKVRITDFEDDGLKVLITAIDDESNPYEITIEKDRARNRYLKLVKFLRDERDPQKRQIWIKGVFERDEITTFGENIQILYDDLPAC